MMKRSHGLGWHPQPNRWEATLAFPELQTDHYLEGYRIDSSRPLIVPTLVITEVVYLIASRLGWQAETRFLGDLAAGEMSLEPVDRKDTLRIAELVARYHDLPLGTVDASVIAAAERLGVTEVATLDLRHFAVVRPHHVEAFNLLPGRG
jgi:uncharacterized protein